MITEDYVSYETAKLLKEKGFDEPCALTEFDCDAYKKWVETAPRPITLDAESEKPFRYSIPSIYVAMKWLRKKKGIAIIPILSSILDNEKFLWDVKIVVAKTGERYSQGWIYEKQEEAFDTAIRYCLESLI